MVPVLTSIYDNLSTPDQIKLPNYTLSSDLMEFQTVLKSIRTLTNSYNKNLIDLENELIEQSAEMGDLNAITILSFNTVKNKITNDSSVSKDDFNHANSLIQQLLDLKHPLTLKFAGDLAFEQNIFKKAIEYWESFISIEPDSINSSHVYYQLGDYNFTHLSNLSKAKLYFEKSIAVGELDNYTVKAHFYLGQLVVDSDPVSAKYHWETSASKGLIDSIVNLGFLEMNVFGNLNQAIEWFKLGVELNQDISCLIGQFDCYVRLKSYKQAVSILDNLTRLNEKIRNVNIKDVPDNLKNSKVANENSLKVFFETRSKDIKRVNQLMV